MSPLREPWSDHAEDHAVAHLNGGPPDLHHSEGRQPPQQAWSYAALIPLPDSGETPFALRVTVVVDEGQVGIGLLRDMDDLAVERRVVASRAEEQVIELPVASPVETWRLLVRNHEIPRTSRCAIRQIELLTEMPASDGVP